MRKYNFDQCFSNNMLTVTSIAGNIFHDKGFESLKNEDFERLKVSRSEIEKRRLRRQTDKGTDVGLDLVAGKILHHGDVITNNEKFILVEQLPEKVISVRLKNKTAALVDLFLLIGHIIGNMHRPISIKNDIVSFPIQADSELEVFQKLFADIIDDIELSIEEMIFFPHTGADVRDHG